MTTGVLVAEIHKPRISKMTSGGAIAIAPPLPAIQFGVAGAMSPYISVPTITIEEGVPGNGYLDVRFAKIAMPTLSASSAVTASLEAEITPPTVLAVSSYSIGNGTEVRFPTPSISAVSSYTTGALATGISMPSVAATSVSTTGYGVFDIPKAKLTVSAFSGTVGYGTFSIKTPAPIGSLTGWESSTGSLSSSIHAPTIILTQSYGTWPCIVINTDTKSLSEYKNYDFLGFANISGICLALHRDGNIYLLGGDTDDGAKISAMFETGMDDSMIGTIKSLHGVVVGLKSDGDTQYRPHFDTEYGDAFTFDSTENHIGSRRADGNQMELSRTIGVEFSNVDGSDFTVDCLDLLVRVSERRTVNRYGR